LAGSQEYDLNVITNPECVIAVIEDIEGVNRVWARTKVQGAVQAITKIQRAFREMKDRVDRNMPPLYLPETQKQMIEENQVIYTIYGGGGNRYKVRLNGDIEFSGFHAASPEHLEKAKSLGMRVFE
jgi:hypothetical protein